MLNLQWELLCRSRHKLPILRGMTPGFWAASLPLLGTQNLLALVSGGWQEGGQCRPVWWAPREQPPRGYHQADLTLTALVCAHI